MLKARILLKADVSEAGEGWSDNRIIAALDTSASMVYLVRKQLVEEADRPCMLQTAQRTRALYASGEGHGIGRFWAGGGMLDQAARAAMILVCQFQGRSSWMRLAG